MPILKVLDGAADIREGADGQIQSELQGCQGLAHLSPGGTAMESVQALTAIELPYSDITGSWHFDPSAINGLDDPISENTQKALAATYYYGATGYGAGGCEGLVCGVFTAHVLIHLLI